ncbi:unnamed protein product [Linum tenue]|uniref:Calmodulin-binding protein n=1 Tax=Linum tenue TaxID=586396 RepID=A0AAV0QRN5_9ROSI|nr:unnamed protein product [Linum tenue]
MQNHQPVEPPPQPASPPSGLQLVFSSKLSLPIFTGTKIVDAGGSPLQILLADTATGTRMDNKVKVEIVVLDGDFPEEDRSSTAWTSEEFGRNVVKERTGKRPLLAGDCLTFTLRDGCASLGEIEFTDNSSWIRSRKFRIGARVVRDGGRGLRVREAMTEAFIVKDHRGELYKKHHPPMLEDEVWRLEKIGKDGAFHKKLAAEGVNSVQDFLKLSVVDPLKLRKMLGAGMSDKMWEVTIKHARRCELGNKHYIYRGPSYCLTLNPICQVVNATISGQDCSNLDISGINKLYIENLVRQAYTNWHDLQEVIGIPSDVASLNQGIYFLCLRLMIDYPSLLHVIMLYQHLV